MKNILKNSLVAPILIVAFLFVGLTNVNAAASVSFREDIDNSEGTIITEFDIGNVSFQSATSSSRNPRKAFRIKNNTISEIQLSTIQFTNPSSPFEIVGIPASKLDGNDSMQITIQVKKGTNVTTPNVITETLEFYVNSTELITVDVKAVIEPAVIPSKPTVARTYTYNGREQTFDFPGYIPSFMDIEGDLFGTNAGNYSVTIKFDENEGKNYAWGDGTNSPAVINFSIEKAEPDAPTYDEKAGTGAKLSTVALPAGWTWDNENTTIEAGDKTYPASYVDADGGNTGNYKDMSAVGLNVNGNTQYTVTIPTNTNFTSTRSTDFKLFVGESETVSLATKVGYLFTSIKLNDVELLTNKVDSYNLEIQNIDKNMDIEIVTERIVITPENIDDLMKFIIGSKDIIKFTFGYDYDVFNVNALRINGKTISMADVDKYFRFTEGSVVIEITNEYLNTLDPGTYDLELDLETGELMKASFVVEQLNATNPSTGDDIIMYSIMVLLAVVGITKITLVKNPKKLK